MDTKNFPLDQDRSDGGDASSGHNVEFASIRKRLNVGGSLFRQGDPTFGLFRLVSGQIRLVRTTSDGRSVPMHTVQAGELFVETSIFSPRYHCDAIAIQNCEVEIFPKRELTRHLKASKDNQRAFSAELAQRVHGLRARLESRKFSLASERVLHYLRAHCNASGVCGVERTLKEMAAEIGMSPEALYRTLSALEQSGQICRDGLEIALIRK